MKRFFWRLIKIASLLVLLALLTSSIDIALLAPWNQANTHSDRRIHAYSGATHIHSRHSDGSGSLAQIIAAAQTENLDFLFITDHNTLALRDSVTSLTNPYILVGAELSLKVGHLLAYGLREIPGKQDRENERKVEAILDSIKSNAGFSIIAHPFHPKMRWKTDTLSDKIDGIEIINADVEWRNDNPLRVLAAFIAYPFFDQAMNYLLDSPEKELAYWDRSLAHRPVAGIGSVDAHAKIKLGSGRFWEFPSYAKTFSLVQNAVLLKEQLPTQPEKARQQILKSLQNGSLLFGFASLGDLKQVQLWCESDSTIYLPGSVVKLDTNADLSLRAALPENLPLQTYLYRNGVSVASSDLSNIEWPVQQEGVYRIIVFQRRMQFPYFTRKRVAWIFSNPFYIEP